jgi:hypothetical protein
VVVARPTFVVNSQPIGCHDAPDATAPIMATLPVGTVQEMDMVLTLPDGSVWHREVDRRCWVRTQPGPVQVFDDAANARSYATRFAPPGTVLFQADWSSGLAGWRSVGGWKTTSVMLLHDGSEDGAVLRPPYNPADQAINDYAVEAEMQMINQWCNALGQCGCGAFGVTARGQINGGINTWCISSSRAGVSIGEDRVRNRTDGPVFDPSTAWHTYRLEVRGNRAVFLVDGRIVDELQDNRFLSGGYAGLYCHRYQLNVRSFKITKL